MGLKPMICLHSQSVSDLLDDKTTEVVCLGEIDSTNNEAKRRIAEGQKNRLLITAERQSAGRGRMGRSFYSYLDGSVYMTLAMPAKAEDPAEITIAAAVATAEAIECCTGIHLGIKWVNDLYLKGKKVCGILCENIANDTTNYIIIGIGINIGHKRIPKELKSIAASIDIGGFPRENLIAEIVNRYDSSKNCSFENILARYRARSVLIGRTVEFEREGTRMQAAVLGIDEKGRLQVQTKEGCVLNLYSGEVSLAVKNE